MSSGEKTIEVYGETSPLLYDVTVIGSSSGGLIFDEEYNENGVGELITAHGLAYNVNIEVFNKLQHTITGWPGGKPDADDTNRPERSSPHPKRVVIFSSEPSSARVSCFATRWKRCGGWLN